MKISRLPGAQVLSFPHSRICANLSCSSPFKGEVRWGMGLVSMKFDPIPTPALPLKGREKYSGALKLALMRLHGNDGFFSFIEIYGDVL